MLSIRHHILWSFALLLLCSSVAWGQERVYGLYRDFSMVVPSRWMKEPHAHSGLSFKRSTPGSAYFTMSAMVLPTSASKDWLPGLGRSLGEKGYTIGETRLVEHPGTSFRVVEMKSDGIDQEVVMVAAAVTRSSNSDRRNTALLSVIYFPQQISKAELNELMEAFYSFRFEGVPKSAAPPTPPPPTVPKESDDF